MSHRLMSHRKPEAVQFFSLCFYSKKIMFRNNVLLFFFKEMCFDIFFKTFILTQFFFPYTIDSFKYLFAYNIASIIKDTSIKHYIQTINYF